MNEEIKFTCVNCGKDFEPEPDMVCEAGMVSEEDFQKFEDEGQQWKGEQAKETEGAVILCIKCVDGLAAGEEPIKPKEIV